MHAGLLAECLKILTYLLCTSTSFVIEWLRKLPSRYMVVPESEERLDTGGERCGAGLSEVYICIHERERMLDLVVW